MVKRNKAEADQRERQDEQSFQLSANIGFHV
jgi:hypothetical protein